jgi:histidine phosphotransferase ChpT
MVHQIVSEVNGQVMLSDPADPVLLFGVSIPKG